MKTIPGGISVLNKETRRYESQNSYILEPGDRIKCQGLTLTIKDIISCDFWGTDKSLDWGFYCEFIAVEDNKYHYWKQQFDGGEVITKKE